MQDILMLLLIAAFFGLCFGLVILCDRLMEHTS